MSQRENMFYERRPVGATHSFRLSPKASQIVDTHPGIRPRKKSFMVSQAIIWFFQSPILTRERDSESGDYTGKYVKGSHGTPTPIELILRIEELEKELDEITRSREIADNETKHVPQSRGRGIISTLFGR
tara:strand:+ start:2327 stop:2716 length:390 start_codon:yes stop_codon:yes gene_type:complete